jgi:hypothetical protein
LLVLIRPTRYPYEELFFPPMTATREAAAKAAHLFHEIWRCANCGREFDDATRCCTHEAQCGTMTHC